MTARRCSDHSFRPRHRRAGQQRGCHVRTDRCGDHCRRMESDDGAESSRSAVPVPSGRAVHADARRRQHHHHRIGRRAQREPRPRGVRRFQGRRPRPVPGSCRRPRRGPLPLQHHRTGLDLHRPERGLPQRDAGPGRLTCEV